VKVFYDTEFLEDGKTIELISIGMVAEDDHEYYAVSRKLAELSWRGWRLRRRIRKHTWLMENVVSNLPQPHGDWAVHMPRRWLFNYNDPAVKPRAVIADQVSAFLWNARRRGGKHLELWADYGAYDHVALAQLFGRMIDLPPGIPMFTHDLQHELHNRGMSNADLPRPEGRRHNALDDARHLKRCLNWLA
jgi:hypothetical protein